METRHRTTGLLLGPSWRLSSWTRKSSGWAAPRSSSGSALAAGWRSSARTKLAPSLPGCSLARVESPPGCNARSCRTRRWPCTPASAPSVPHDGQDLAPAPALARNQANLKYTQFEKYKKKYEEKITIAEANINKAVAEWSAVVEIHTKLSDEKNTVVLALGSGGSAVNPNTLASVFPRCQPVSASGRLRTIKINRSRLLAG